MLSFHGRQTFCPSACSWRVVRDRRCTIYYIHTNHTQEKKQTNEGVEFRVVGIFRRIPSFLARVKSCFVDIKSFSYLLGLKGFAFCWSVFVGLFDQHFPLSDCQSRTRCEPNSFSGQLRRVVFGTPEWYNGSQKGERRSQGTPKFDKWNQPSSID